MFFKFHIRDLILNASYIQIILFFSIQRINIQFQCIYLTGTQYIHEGNNTIDVFISTIQLPVRRIQFVLSFV